MREEQAQAVACGGVATGWAVGKELFGPPIVSLDEMIEATAHWIQIGGETHGKPTHFEVHDGTF